MRRLPIHGHLSYPEREETNTEMFFGDSVLQQVPSSVHLLFLFFLLHNNIHNELFFESLR